MLQETSNKSVCVPRQNFTAATNQLIQKKIERKVLINDVANLFGLFGLFAAGRK